MAEKPPRLPTYRLHRASGQAIVTLDGHDCYLGRHGTARSRRAYERLLGEYLAAGRHLPDRRELTVTELILAYWDGHVSRRYQPRTGHRASLRRILRPLRRLYGPTAAAAFGPVALQSVRRTYLADGLARPTVNRYVGQLRRMFRWAVSQELIRPEQLTALAAVEGLRCDDPTHGAPEPPAVRPVPLVDVLAVEPHVSRPVWSMIELQLVTGMRPGEVVGLCPCDIDRSGPIWRYEPARHKTDHHVRGGRRRRRIVDLGPRAQRLLLPLLGMGRCPDAPLFAPPTGPGSRGGSVYRRKRPGGRSGRRLGAAYLAASYRRAIARACRRAGVERWSPNRLRHLYATQAAAGHDLQAAQQALGHASIRTTEGYVEPDRSRAVRLAREIG